MKIRKGDQVQILSGKDRGKKGKVLYSYPKKGKVVVEGMNLAKRHRRPRKEGEKGQRVEVPSPIDVSNLMLICPRCGKGTRIGYKIENEKKFRLCKKCQAEIDN
jgi:large subunit ribosomal protein L24